MFGMILAAGRGQRLMPLTKNTPKPLIKVKGITLIEYAIQAFKKANIYNIVINISYLGEQIKKYLGDGEKFGVNIIYSEETTALETAGGIIKALPLLNSKTFIVINSDIVCDYDLSKLNLDSNTYAHLVLIKNPKHNLNGDFGLKNKQITLENKQYTFSGIGIYNNDFFKKYQKKQKIALYPLLKQAIKDNKLTGEVFEGSWEDIGTIERLKLVNN